MRKLLILVLISPVLVQQSKSKCSQLNELQSTCGHYCFEVVRLLLSTTRDLHTQLSDLQNSAELNGNQTSIHAKLEQIFEYLQKIPTRNNNEVLVEKLQNIVDKIDALERNSVQKSNAAEVILNKQCSDSIASFQNLKNVQEKLENVQKRLETQISNAVIKIEEIGNQTENWFEKQMKNTQTKLNDRENTEKPYQKIGSKYYYIEQNEMVNWSAALQKCRDSGGHLASIKNSLEFDNIVDHLTANENYWIDINDLSTEGEFISETTGLKATYFNWHPDNPSNFLNCEHCVELWYINNEHKMNDDNCVLNKFFICESENVN